MALILAAMVMVRLVLIACRFIESTEAEQAIVVSVCAGKPNSVFDSASQKAALKFKYKLRVVNGIAVATSGVQSQFEYELGE